MLRIRYASVEKRYFHWTSALTLAPLKERINLF